MTFTDIFVLLLLLSLLRGLACGKQFVTSSLKFELLGLHWVHNEKGSSIFNMVNVLLLLLLRPVGRIFHGEVHTSTTGTVDIN